MKFRYLLSLATALGIVSSTVFGQVQSTRFKDWQYKRSANYWEASTENSSGSELGIICVENGNSCFAYYQDGARCEKDSSYPVLWNSESGSQLLTATCTNMGNSGYLLILDHFDSVRNSILKDPTAGLAIPLASGQFKVLRLSLVGSNESIAAMVNDVQSGSAKSSSVKNANQVL